MAKISELVKEAYDTAVGRGFHDSPTEFGTLLALVHTEVKEVFDAQTNQDTSEELADVLIRIFDLSGYFQIDLEKAFSKVYVGNEMEEIRKKIHRITKEEGSLEKTTYCLRLHNTICDAMETFRLKMDEKEKKEQLAEDLMRIVDLALEIEGRNQLNVLSALYEKMEKNKKRPHKHGKIV